MTELAGDLVFALQHELCTDLVHDCLELGRIEDVEGGKGGIWVISGHTLVRLEGVRSWPAADLGNIQALLVDRSDRAWVATSRGLEWRVRSQAGLQGEIAWGEAPLQALAWCDKRQQRMWSMTQNGEILELAVQGPRIQNVGVFPSGLPKELVNGATMHASPDGLFILTSRGIYFLRPPRELTAWKR